jgi:hypothetical protein
MVYGTGASRLGSSLSVTGMTRVRDRMSALCAVHLGSSFSLRGFSRLDSGFSVCPSAVVDVGRSLSVLDFGAMGSSLSIRSVAIAGSGFPVFNVVRLGCSVSVQDSGILSSGLSLLMSGRLGSNYSVGSCSVYRRVFGENVSVVDDFPDIDFGRRCVVQNIIFNDKGFHSWLFAIWYKLVQLNGIGPQTFASGSSSCRDCWLCQSVITMEKGNLCRQLVDQVREYYYCAQISYQSVCFVYCGVFRVSPPRSGR